MNISFDLDGTLIPNGNEFETEKRSVIAKFIGVENIRKGTSRLISELQKKGHIIHIYTTSYRKKRQIRLTLKYYGVNVKKIVNQIENQKVLNQRNIYSSKFPTAFGFDIHIDDLKGVGMESEKYHFKAIIIEPSNTKWKEKIITEIEKETLKKDQKEFYKFNLIFLRNSKLILSNKKYQNWKEIQTEYNEYMTSLNFEKIKEIKEYLTIEYKLKTEKVNELVNEKELNKEEQIVLKI